MNKSWIVGKKEFLTNVLSIRFLIIVLIFSILVVGVTYGETLTTQQKRETTHILMTHYVDHEDDGDYDDLVLYYSDEWGNPIDGKEIKLYDMLNVSEEERIDEEEPESEPEMARTTGKNGMALFEGIKDFVHETDGGYMEYIMGIEFSVEDQDKIDTIDGHTSIHQDFKDDESVNDSFSQGSFFDISFRDLGEGTSNNALYHAVEPDGSPSTEAELYVNEHLFSLNLTEYKNYLEEGTVDPVLKEAFGNKSHHIDEEAVLSEEDGVWAISMNEEILYLLEIKLEEEKLKIYHDETKVAESDEYGYIEYEFSKGAHRVKLQNEYNSWNYTTHEIREAPDSTFEIDSILNEMTFSMILVLPLVAIALSFDSVTKERESNSLFFLLAKPIERWKIGVGKLIGAFFAVAMPVIVVNSVSISLMWYMLGATPSFNLILTFFLGSLALLIFFLTLQTMLSTLTDSSVTSLLGGLSFWFLLGLFYPAVEDGITSLLGYEYGTYNHEVFTSYMILANPNMIFMETMDLIYRGRFGLDFLPGISDLSLIVAMVIWVIGSIVAFLIIFQKRLVSD